jgi:dipeptidyl aminopeptidase/acylaminoacyl peptidase
MPRPFVNDDMFRFDAITTAQLSPDGQQVLYAKMVSDTEQATEYTNLWLCTRNGTHHTAMTSGPWIDSHPTWSPDGRQIAFVSQRQQPAQLFCYDMATTACTQLTNHSTACQGPLVWSPDSTTIAYTVVQAPTSTDRTKPYRLTRAIPRFDAIGIVADTVNQLMIIDVASRDTTRLTTDDGYHTPCAWSPDGTRILDVVSFLPERIDVNARIDVVTRTGIAQTILDHDWGIIQHASWLANEDIVVAGIPAGGLYGSKNNLYLIPNDESPMICRTASLAHHLEARIHDDSLVPWTANSLQLIIHQECQYAVMCYQVGGEVQLIRIALYGPEDCHIIANGPRLCYPFSSVANEVLFGVATPTDPCQLRLLSLTTGRETPLTDVNHSIRGEINWPSMHQLSFLSHDQTTVEGWMYVPTDANAPHPTVLFIHGGPHAAHGHAFFYDVLALTSAGYAVLMINYRGSTGYGNAFATAINANWGYHETYDLLAGVDHAVALGFADPHRLACAGLSAGGYHTCWLISHDQRFRAAVAENPVTNWHSFYGTSDIGPTFAVRELGGTPYQVPDTYHRCSPITYALACQTPTLLIVGEEDRRCPAEQAEQFYTVLKTTGCPTEMLRLPGCAHGDSTTGPWLSRIAQNTAMVEWLQRFV